MAEKKNPVDYYDGVIAAYERAYKTWEGRAKKIVDRYRDEQRAKQDNDQTKFNILWSNVNTLVPACYSQVPKADVGRRHRDQDPVGRVASLILERALTFEMEHYPDYRSTMRQAVLDRFLPGRGTAWARYEPHFKAGEQLPEDGLEVTEDVDDENESIDYECAPVDYVHWKDFGHNVGRTWEEVYVVWRIVYMYEEGVKERFGEDVSKKLSYDATPEDKKRELTQQEVKKQAKIYEVWDKQKGKVIWLSRAKKEKLDERDDPLGLQGFFPCPRPLFATMTNDTLIPVPDFALYQDQARELDIIADRIDGLVRMLQVKGCYDSSTPELARLFTEGVNGTLIPVKNFAAFAERKGLAGSIDMVDLKPIYEAIKVCFESAREIMNFIYQITGISDIVRGQTEASETLGAQQLKVNFVGLRLGDMKRDVARFATDLLQLKAQVICQHFAPQTIMEMAAVEQLAPADMQYVYQFQPPAPPQIGPDGQPMPPQPPQPMLGPDGKPMPGKAMELLIGKERLLDPASDSPNPLRAFRIEINTDSLVQIDEQAEKDSANEFVAGVARFMEATAQIGAASPTLVPPMLELLKWSMTKFKIGKTVEGTIDIAIEQATQAAKQPPPPDPKIQAAQMKMKSDQEKAQLDMKVASQDANLKMQTMQAEQQHDQAELAMDGQRLQMEGQAMAMEANIERQSLQAKNQQMQVQNKMKNEQMHAQHQMKMQQAKQKPAKPK